MFKMIRNNRKLIVYKHVTFWIFQFFDPRQHPRRRFSIFFLFFLLYVVHKLHFGIGLKKIGSKKFLAKFIESPLVIPYESYGPVIPNPDP